MGAKGSGQTSVSQEYKQKIKLRRAQRAPIVYWKCHWGQTCDESLRWFRYRPLRLHQCGQCSCSLPWHSRIRQYWYWYLRYADVNRSNGMRRFIVGPLSLTKFPPSRLWLFVSNNISDSKATGGNSLALFSFIPFKLIQEQLSAYSSSFMNSAVMVGWKTSLLLPPIGQLSQRNWN